MLTYCLVCRKNTENKDVKMIKTKNSRLMLSSKSAVFGNKKIQIYKRTRSRRIVK